MERLLRLLTARQREYCLLRPAVDAGVCARQLHHWVACKPPGYAIGGIRAHGGPDNVGRGREVQSGLLHREGNVFATARTFQEIRRTPKMGGEAVQWIIGSCGGRLNTHELPDREGTEIHRADSPEAIKRRKYDVATMRETLADPASAGAGQQI